MTVRTPIFTHLLSFRLRSFVKVENRRRAERYRGDDVCGVGELASTKHANVGRCDYVVA